MGRHSRAVGAGSGDAMSLLAIVLASFLGSLHCATMCGGIAACVGAAPSTVRRAAWSRALAYHGARLAGYLALGVVAGLLGAGIEGFGRAALGLADIAGVVMGVVLLGLALRQLLPARARGLVQLRPRAPLLTRWLPRGNTGSAALVGLLTAVLPCGWLWSFVVLAAARADAGAGAAVMSAMWLGTIPALTTVGIGSAWLARTLGRHAPKLTAAILIVLAIASISGRLMPVWTMDEDQERPSCH